jgi:hypothetical protein
MKNVITLVACLSLAFAGGLSPEYGPTDWNAIGSTSQGFVVFDNISIDGAPAVGGTDDGSSTGSCGSGDCDIVALMYGANCVGWSYSTMSNGQVTIAVNFNDFVTPGVEDYPGAGSTVSVNMYDASAGLILYSVASATVIPLSQAQQGDLDAVGADGDSCPYVGADNFDQFGAGGSPANCDISACCDGSAVNTDAYASEGNCSDDGSCDYAGCQDPNASNHYDDGYDCAGGTDGDQSCCTYLPSWGGVSASNVSTDEGYATSSVQLNWSTPQGGTVGDGWSFDMPDGGESCSDRTETTNNNPYPPFDKVRYDLDEKYRMIVLDMMRYVDENGSHNGSTISDWTVDNYTQHLTAEKAIAFGANVYVPEGRDSDHTFQVCIDSWASEGSWSVYSYSAGGYITDTQYFSAGGECNSLTLNLAPGTYDVDSWDSYGDGGQDVYVDGAYVGSSSGSYSYITVELADPPPCTNFTLTVGGGSWDSEITWDLSDGSSGAAGTFDLCLYDGDYTFNGYDSYGDGWNGASATFTDSDGNVIGNFAVEGSSGSWTLSVGVPVVAGCTDPDAPIIILMQQ